MANNFKSTEVTLTNASETNIVTATSNNQIIIGLNACNTSTTASITLDVTMRDGSNDFKLAKAVSIPPSSKYTGQIFADTNTSCKIIFKYYNGSAFVTVFEVATGSATATIPSTVNIEGESDPNAIPFAIALGG